MKKTLSLLMLFPLLALSACAPAGTPADPNDPTVPQDVDITLYTYPIGGWKDASAIAPFLTAFHSSHPRIHVTVKSVDYVTGDAEVNAAIEAKEADIVLEGPERLVADWGARGVMADLGDLWESAEAKTILGSVADACHDAAGNYYIYPLCMTTHCMAINRELFEAAGAWDFIDETTHTWTTDGFVGAVERIDAYYREHGVYDEYREKGVEVSVASVYCESQAGDQGTRALVTNLGGGTFTNAEHTAYTVNSPENIAALELLQGLQDKGVRFDPEMNGAEEQVAFRNGELAMSFCWNVAAEVNSTVLDPDRAFDIFPMAFPTKNGAKPLLQGGIWGFGVFDNGDPARVAAAKEFIRFINGEKYAGAVTTSAYLPVRTLDRNPYENDELMEEYGIFSDYLGDFYQITLNWQDARDAWWPLLRKVGAKEDVAAAIESFPIFATQA